MSGGCQNYQNMEYKYVNEMSCQRVIQVEFVRFGVRGLLD